jgi:DNA-binding IclR family transcriptional regulator
MTACCASCTSPRTGPARRAWASWSRRTAPPAARRYWRESLLSSALRAYTDRTITDPGAVEREAATTRERGYAIEDGEYRPGVRALAAPVHADARATIAAIGVSTSGTLDVESVSDDVTRAAATLSSALAPPVGHRGPPEE